MLMFDFWALMLLTLNDLCGLDNEVFVLLTAILGIP